MDNLDHVEDSVTVNVRGEEVTLHFTMATARWFQNLTKKSFLGGWNPQDPVEVLTALYVGSLKDKPEWGNDGKATKAGRDQFVSDVENEKTVKEWIEMLPLILKALGVTGNDKGEEDDAGKM